MLVYVAIPYALEHLVTQNKAIMHLNRFIGETSRKVPRFIGINSLYTVYNNPISTKPVGYKELYATSASLMQQCNSMIVLKVPGWDYTDILLNELFYFQSLNKPIFTKEFDNMSKPLHIKDDNS